MTKTVLRNNIIKRKLQWLTKKLGYHSDILQNEMTKFFKILGIFHTPSASEFRGSYIENLRTEVF